MNAVLIKKNGRFVETRLSAYRRYKNTIKPLDDLLKALEEKNEKERND